MKPVAQVSKQTTSSYIFLATSVGNQHCMPFSWILRDEKSATGKWKKTRFCRK